MTHETIQEKLLLYLDGELPGQEMSEIRDHLATCTSCSKRYTFLASIWKSEVATHKVQPSPFIWTRLQARIDTYEQTPGMSRVLKAAFGQLFARPLFAVAILVALAVGIYLGTPPSVEQSSLMNQSLSMGDDFGLDQFDIVPPGSLGRTVVNLTNTEKRGLENGR